MTTKILNLDHFVQVERQVTIKGKTYDVAPKTVQLYLDAARHQETFDQLTKEQQVEASISALSQSLVGIERGVLLSLSFDQLNVLMQFIAGIDEPEVASEDQQGDQKKA